VSERRHAMGDVATGILRSIALDRRSFIRQSVAFSALAAIGSRSCFATTLSSDPTAADLLMVGDWGADGDYSAQNSVAAGMRQYVQQHDLKAGALLMLGDNWYGALDSGVQSGRWQTQFEQMYPAEVFSCPAYAIPGNHDYQHWPDSKITAELEYARISKSRWTMPALWYRFEFPTKRPLITFLALDSNMPYADGTTSHGRDFTLTEEQRTEQLRWLVAELKRPRTTPFLVVMGHHPIYSDGPHGDHKILMRDWDPLFREYGVHLYLAGHDHDLQHLEFEGHPTSHFLSGGGGADLYALKIDPSKRGPYAQKVFGFSHLSVTPKQMTLRHLDSSGRALHAFTKTVDGKVAIL
jgi:tartrate-resistant acid phosphatase type 5